MKRFVFIFTFMIACKASFSGSGTPAKNPVENEKPTTKPGSTPNPIAPTAEPITQIPPVTHFSMLTVTYPTIDPKLQQFQILLKGGPNDWQDVSYSVGGEAYVPNLCDQDHLSYIAVRGRHLGDCNFTVGVTNDTRIANSSANSVTFDLSEKCNEMSNPTTFTLKCQGLGLKLVAP